MRIYRTATLTPADQIPFVGQREWMVPIGAVLLRHVYLRDDQSPRRKDYIVRVYALDARENNIPCSYLVTNVSWGGSIDVSGRSTPSGSRSSQVKEVTRSDRQVYYLGGLGQHMGNNQIEAKLAEAGSNYRKLVDLSFGSNLNVLSASVPTLTGGAVSINTLALSPDVLEAASRHGPTPPTVPVRPRRSTGPATPRPELTTSPTGATPRTRPERNPPSSPPPSQPPPAPVTDADRLKALKDITLAMMNEVTTKIKNNDEQAVTHLNGIIQLLSDPTKKEDRTYQILFSPELKPSLQNMFNAAVMNNSLFFKILAMPKSVLDEIGLSAEAQQAIQDYLDLEQGSEQTPVRKPRKFAKKEV